MGTLLCYLSDDNGLTWHRGKQEWKVFNDNGQRITVQEPGVIELKDGRVMMFIRSSCGSQMVSYSSDGGETWSPAIRVAQGNWGVNTANVIEWSFGDPAAVADNTPGNSGNDVLMVCCGGNARWTNSVYNPDVSQQQQGCVAWRSTDGGETWSEPAFT